MQASTIRLSDSLNNAPGSSQDSALNKMVIVSHFHEFFSALLNQAQSLVMSDAPEQCVKSFLNAQFSPLLDARTKADPDTILDALVLIENGSQRLDGRESNGIQAIERTILYDTLPILKNLLENTLPAVQRLTGPSADCSALALQDFNLQENNIATRLRKDALRGLTATLLLHGSLIDGSSDLRFLTRPVFSAEHAGLLNSILYLSSYQYTGNDEVMLADIFHVSDPNDLATIKSHLTDKTETWRKEALSLLDEFIVANTRSAINTHLLITKLTKSPNRSDLDPTTFFIFPEEGIESIALQSATSEIFGRGENISGCFEQHVYSPLRNAIEAWGVIKNNRDTPDWNILDALIRIRKL